MRASNSERLKSGARRLNRPSALLEPPPAQSVSSARARGSGTLLGVLGGYLLAIVAATSSIAFHLGAGVPGPPLDPLVHLWTMRWYKTCLATGTSPLVCPNIQYPEGAPLGLFPPMQLQTALYLPLSRAVGSDVICYNLIWYFAFLFAGMGTFLLAHEMVKNRLAAALAGLLVMLSTPMMLHAYGHLELMHLGAIPIFFWAWIRFVERPGGRTLLGAVAAYLLAAACAHYFVLLCVFPAALFLGWHLARAGRANAVAWLRARWAWLAAFGVLGLLGVALLYASQLAVVFSGSGMARPRSEFLLYRAPLWGYFVPTIGHRLGWALLPFDPYQAAGMGPSAGERASYLGLVMLVLLPYAAIKRASFPRASFWWLALGLMILLSLGAYVQIGSTRLPMPCDWLWHVFPPMRLIRVVARFNMLATVCAAVIAGAGLAHILLRIEKRAVRVAVVMALALVALLDQGSLTYRPNRIPPLPATYGQLLKRDPAATFLEIPHMPSGGCALNAATEYWQALHHGKTSGGYAAHPNRRYDQLLFFPSPFFAWNLANPSFLANPQSVRIDLQPNVHFLDYAWLYLTVHGYKYVVLHKWPEALADSHAQIEELQTLLHPARIAEDAQTVVYDRSMLPAPMRATLLCTEGWRERRVWRGGCFAVVGKRAQLVLYNPEAAQPLLIVIDAQAFCAPRRVRLRLGRRILARWQVDPGAFRLCATPPLVLPAGLQQLVLESDGDEVPQHSHEMAAEGDPSPYSLRISGVSLRSASESGAEPGALAAAVSRPAR